MKQLRLFLVYHGAQREMGRSANGQLHSTSTHPSVPSTAGALLPASRLAGAPEDVEVGRGAVAQVMPEVPITIMAMAAIANGQLFTSSPNTAAPHMNDTGTATHTCGELSTRTHTQNMEPDTAA